MHKQLFIFFSFKLKCNAHTGQCTFQNWTVQEFSHIETTHITRPRSREGNLPAPYQ